MNVNVLETSELPKSNASRSRCYVDFDDHMPRISNRKRAAAFDTDAVGSGQKQPAMLRVQFEMVPA